MARHAQRSVGRGADRPGAATRRELVGRAVAIGGLAAAPSVRALLSAAPVAAATGVETDPGLLYELLGVELLVEFVYRRAVHSGLLSARSEHVAAKLLGHERAHAAALSRELERRGGGRPTAPASTTVADQALADHHVAQSLDGLASEHDWIGLLLEVEAVVQGAYYDALSELNDVRLLRIGAEILASEAQHATVLSRLLDADDVSKAVPSAFVQGSG